MTSGSNLDHDQLDPALDLRLQLDAQGGPAARIGKDRARELVMAAISAASTDTPLVAGRQEAPAKAAHRSRMAVAAAALLVAFISGASASLWVWGRREERTAPAVQPSAPALERRQATRSDEPALVEQQPEPDEVVTKPANKPRRAEGISEDLLERANRLRAEGAFAEARDVYAQVVRRNPSSLSAYAAQVAAGSLELEHLGRPEEARRQFERALAARPTGALSLEVYQGLAASYAALGRVRDEARILERLVTAYPNAHAAKRARARLEELENAR